METAVTQAVQKVGPAVVTIVGTIPGQMTFFGQTGDQTVSGSGFFISDQGYILTNNHVVEGTKEVNIILSDGTEEKATLVGTDPYSDIAILKADGKVPAVATLGNSDLLNSGESVIAIGSPLGNFKNTVTVGVVSATGTIHRHRAGLPDRRLDPNRRSHQSRQFRRTAGQPGRRGHRHQ